MLIGLATGLLPMLLYNISSQQGKYGNSLTILLELINGGPSPMKHTLTTLMHELHGTIGISIPMMTGEPFCPVTEIPFLGPNSPHSSSCTLIHWSWGLGYLLLFIIALIVASFAVWHALKAYHHRQDQSQYKHEYQELVRSTGRLTLLISGLLSLIIYTYSSPPTLWPGIFARYLIGLLLITPALIAPLWQAMVSNLGNKQHPATRHGMIFAAGSGLVLTLIGVFLVIGVFTTFGEIPYDTQRYQTDMHLIQNLEHLGIKHAYTDYWTCDKMAFLSNEQIICGVVNQQSAPGLNRYMPYYTAVKQDPGAAYLFPINPNIPPGSIHIKNIEQRLKDFHRYIMDGYIIYLPG
jgi:MFS family permease